ncbi:MAG: hypothetical protein R3315_04105 [Woeseiaceae bacterium]|nr:hypothetical protein [Woeseiaceae bacterium]
MNRKHSVALITGMLASLVATSAIACGESLFRVGKGVGFREYTAPLPGSILVVANTEAELLMVERLAAAGHDIHVVADPSQIEQELARHDVDIVLAYFRDRGSVEGQLSAMTAATYIPVAMDGTAEIRQASELYPRSLSNEDSVLTFLKTIHKTLKSRS